MLSHTKIFHLAEEYVSLNDFLKFCSAGSEGLLSTPGLGWELGCMICRKIL